jgi:hypothetical protein
VSAVEYHYNSYGFDLWNEKLIFTLLTLEQNGRNFTIRNVINVTSTPTADICNALDVNLEHVCRDTLQLDAVNNFDLPTPNFAFGIIARSGEFGLGDLLTYDIDSPYAVEHYRPSTVENTTVGTTISVESLSRERQLRLFKFIISKSVA